VKLGIVATGEHQLPVWSMQDYVIIMSLFWLYCACANKSLSLSLMQQEVVPVVVK